MCEEHKAKLEKENYHLYSELQTETLNEEIERLENASKEEIVKLKSEISSLKSQLYQAKKDVRDKENYISILEKCLEESEEQVEKLQCQIRTISLDVAEEAMDRAQIFALQNNLAHLRMAGYAPKIFAGKKWQLNHVRCGNAIANIAAIVTLNNANINATMINVPDSTPLSALPVGATGATIIPAHNVHADEDWSYAEGCPVNAARSSISLKEIILHCSRVTGIDLWYLIQGSGSVRNFYRKLDKPLNTDLIETLEEIETKKNNMLLGKDIYSQLATKTKPKTFFHQSIITEDVDRIKNITKADLQAIAKSFQETMSQAIKTLDNSKKLAEPDSDSSSDDTLSSDSSDSDISLPI
ncbi:hypothetical protein GLOIN_2v1886689 [Rhizophagus clarus]|uniref:Uncharacterized protein n=1 Tax=Rhizophagus clarus TaxID=94130 RepID=A0A8H3LBQ8_9GLOM|nr:hypothetical protein GLOIN_2v1886689 [Rhizophagus clarus]